MVEDVNQIRIQDIKNQIKDLENQEKKVVSMLSKYEKISNITTGISLTAASFGTVVGALSAASLMFPIAAIVIAATVICAVSTGINKHFTKKSKKQIKDLENVRNNLKN